MTTTTMIKVRSKTFSSWIVLTMTCLLLGSLQVMHAHEPCQSECPENQAPWSPPTIYVIQVAQDCSVELTVRTRLCFATWDLDVMSVNIIGACVDFPLRAAIEQALRTMVTNNVMNFPPGNTQDNGVWYWRISRPACWRKYNGFIQSCEPECCITYLRAERQQGCSTWAFTDETIRRPFQACPIPKKQPNSGEIPLNVTCATDCYELAPGARQHEKKNN